MLHTEIEIKASAQQVWAILSDFQAYPAWNPFIKSVVGKPEQGEKLHIEVQPGDGKSMRFSPKVLIAEPERELRWLGQLGVRGLFDGEHYFIIKAVSESLVHFQHGERFSGLFVGMLRSSLERDTKRGFEEMNQALQARAEARYAARHDAKQSDIKREQ